MQARSHFARIDWGHALLVLAFATITGLYLADSWDASTRVKNLILVLPASLLSFVLCVFVLVGICTGARPEPDDGSAGSADDAAPLVTRLKTPLTMLLFAGYIASLPYLGFDVGTAVFMAAMLLLDGVRNPLMLIGLPIVFALAVSVCFQWLLPYPMPMLLL